jgi:hypothetical protein
MSVTRTLMGSGSFSIAFKGDTPQSVIDACTLVGTQVFVGPQVDVIGMADATLLAAMKTAKAYAGVILDRPDPFTIEGADLSWYLGQADGPSPSVTDVGISLAGSRTTTQWIDAILPAKGLTKGTVTNGTAIVDGVIPPLSASPLAAIQWVCLQSAVEYRVNCDGTVDVGPSTTLFPAPTSTSGTVVTRDRAGDEGSLEGVQAAEMARRRSAWDVASRAVAAYEGTAAALKFVTASQTPTDVDWVDFAGVAYGARDIYVDAEVLPTAAKAQLIADATVALHALDQREVTLSTETHNVVGDVLPGERVFVYDTISGLFDLAGPQFDWRGRLITPVTLRVAEVTYPIIPGLGVYLRRGGVWTDITGYVLTEEGDVTWVVTANGWRLNSSPIGRGLINIPMTGGATQAVSQSKAASRGATAASDTGGAGWVPTITGLNVGTGVGTVLEGDYFVSGGLMYLRVRAVLGPTGSSVTGSIEIEMPDGWQINPMGGATNDLYPSRVRIRAGGIQSFVGCVARASATALSVFVERADVADVRIEDFSATNPGTFAAGDFIIVNASVPVVRA